MRVRLEWDTAANLSDLLKVFVDIALRRRGPQDLPVSSFLLWITLGAYLIMAAAGGYFWLSNVQPGGIVLLSVVDLGILVVWFWSVLAICHRQHRFLQTVTALLGTGALIGLLHVGLGTLYGMSQQDVRVAQLAGLGLFVLLIWWLVIVSDILRNALDIGMPGGVALASLYIVTHQAVFFALVRPAD